MSLSGSRLRTNIYNETKSQLTTQFGSFKAGLQAGEQTAFDSAIDKLASAIADGDAPITVTEIDTNAVVSGTIQTPGAQAGASTLTNTFTLGVD